MSSTASKSLRTRGSGGNGGGGGGQVAFGSSRLLLPPVGEHTAYSSASSSLPESHVPKAALDMGQPRSSTGGVAAAWHAPDSTAAAVEAAAGAVAGRGAGMLPPPISIQSVGTRAGMGEPPQQSVSKLPPHISVPQQRGQQQQLHRLQPTQQQLQQRQAVEEAGAPRALETVLRRYSKSLRKLFQHYAFTQRKVR